MKLTKEYITNAVVNWAMQSRGNFVRAMNLLLDTKDVEADREIEKKNGNGFIERSPHQRRRGRPRKRGFHTTMIQKAPGEKRKYTKKSAYWDK